MRVHTSEERQIRDTAHLSHGQCHHLVSDWSIYNGWGLVLGKADDVLSDDWSM